MGSGIWWGGMRGYGLLKAKYRERRMVINFIYGLGTDREQFKNGTGENKNKKT